MAAAHADDKQSATALWGTLLAVTAIRSYFLMLALGVLHLQWTHNIPALGLWECAVLSTAFTLVKR